MFRYFLIVALLPAMGFATNVNPCRGGEPFPTAARVIGCDTMPCPIYKGFDAVMEMDFTVGGNIYIFFLFQDNFKLNYQSLDTTITSLTPKMTAYALGQTVNYPLPDEILDVCANLGTSQCPLDPTEEATWFFVFSVGQEYPIIELTIEASLTDDNDNVVGCFSLDAHVVGDEPPEFKN